VSLAAASGAWGLEFAGDPGPGPWAGLDAGGGGRSARVWLRAAKERTAKVTLKRQLGPGGRAEGRELSSTSLLSPPQGRPEDGGGGAGCPTWTTPHSAFCRSSLLFMPLPPVLLLLLLLQLPLRALCLCKRCCNYCVWLCHCCSCSWCGVLLLPRLLLQLHVSLPVLRWRWSLSPWQIMLLPLLLWCMLLPGADPDQEPLVQIYGFNISLNSSIKQFSIEGARYWVFCTRLESLH